MLMQIMPKPLGTLWSIIKGANRGGGGWLAIAVGRFQ